MSLASPPLGRPQSSHGMMHHRDQSHGGRARGGANGYGASFSGGDQEEEDEEEEEEEDPMLGFMFGNLDDSGALDEEYLDQEAKEHLSALGPSLKLAKALLASEAQNQDDQDYDNEKADNAVDYEDFKDEDLDDQMQPEEQKFYAQAALATPFVREVEEEENYDEDDAVEVQESSDKVILNSAVPDLPVPPPIPSLQPGIDDFVSDPSVLLLSDTGYDTEDDEVDMDTDGFEESPNDEVLDEVPSLPVLFRENGQDVLRFSEIFSVTKPYWTRNKKPRSKRLKGRPPVDTSLADDDADILRSFPPDYEPTDLQLHEEVECKDFTDEEDFVKRDRFRSGEPLNDEISSLAAACNVLSTNFDPVHQVDWENDILWDPPRKQSDEPDEGQMDKIIVVETFREGMPSRKTRAEVRHPQMLRLETQRSASGLVKRLDRLNLDSYPRNINLAGEGWLEDICWDPDSPRNVARSKLIFDLMDCRMVFEVTDARETKYIRDHAAAMIVTPTGKDKTTDAPEPVLPTRFNISNDKYYNVKKAPQKVKKRVLHGAKVAHSVPALKLQTMKPKLSNKDLSNFHRPKATWFPHHNEVAARKQGELAFKGAMKVILKTLGGKGSKLLVDGSDTLETFKTKAAKKITDLKPSEKTKVVYLGKELEETKTFAEQGVRPNSVLHLVRTKVYPWPKAHRPLDGNKPTRPPGAFKKKSELSAKDGRVALMEYCEERPLLLSNVGMGAVFSTYYRKMSTTDSTASTLKETRGPSVGAVIALEPGEESPFLGNVLPGEPQSCLETNMYRAPAFEHRPAATDFLLVRSPKGKLSIRRIDRTHVVGQQEPHIEVMAPSSKGVLNYLGNRLQVYMYREFRAKEKPGILPQIGADELMAQFPSLTDTFIRKRLKGFADLQRGANGDMRWVMRSGFRIPTEEEIRRLVSPEHVCSYESMQAGIHHLKRMGVHKLTQPTGLSTAMNQLPDEALALAAASHIERELQLTPWNLSSNFVAAAMQGRHGLERLEITGAGDPSGRGLGFSYLRAAARPVNTGAIVEKKAAAARGGGAVTGTDADLRRLSMDNAREVLLKFGVSEQEIEKLTRWHRIAMVRKLSSEQAVSGGAPVEAAALNKYARGQRLPFIHQHQQGRLRCQEIWDRQVQSLMALDGDGYESEGEGNGDLDDFAGDLENLLEVELECDTSKKEKKEIRGIGARRRAMQAQLEEEQEDEEAEAAELHRMLMEDDDEDEKKRKAPAGSSGPVTPSGGAPSPLPPPPPAVPTPPKQKKKRKIIKRIIRQRQPNGTIKEQVVVLRDPKEIEAYMAEKAAKEKAIQKVSNDLGAKPTGKMVKVKRPTTLMNNTQNQLKLSKQHKDGLQLVCGSCGQIGHMRTNKKKCPRYQEEAAGNGQRFDGDAHVDRPLPKLIVKQKKMEELTGIRVTTPEKKNTVIPIPRKLKVKFPSSGFPPDSGLGSAKSSSNNAPTPVPTPPPLVQTPVQTKKPVTTTNGHGHSFKVKLKINVKAPRQEPVVDPEVLKQQLEMERERTKQELEEKERREREREQRREMEREREREKERERLLERERKEQEERERLEWERNQRELERKHQMEREVEARKLEIAQLEQREMERKRRLEGEEAEKQRKKRKIKEPKKERQKEDKARDDNYQEPKRTQKLTLKRREPVEAEPPASKRQRKRGGGQVELANILEGIVEQLKLADCSYLFRKPVTKKEAPDYHIYIQKPMDLSTMRDRVRGLQYRNRDDFLKDMHQIVNNAHKYNDGRNPGIPPLADALLDICEELMAKKNLELIEAEDRIGDEPAATSTSGRKRGLR